MISRRDFFTIAWRSAVFTVVTAGCVDLGRGDSLRNELTDAGRAAVLDGKATHTEKNLGRLNGHLRIERINDDTLSVNMVDSDGEIVIQGPVIKLQVEQSATIFHETPWIQWPIKVT